MEEAIGKLQNVELDLRDRARRLRRGETVSPVGEEFDIGDGDSDEESEDESEGDGSAPPGSADAARHLPALTKKAPQLSDARCPTDPFRHSCPCMERLDAWSIKPKKGPIAMLSEGDHFRRGSEVSFRFVKGNFPDSGNRASSFHSLSSAD